MNSGIKFEFREANSNIPPTPGENEQEPETIVTPNTGVLAVNNNPEVNTSLNTNTIFIGAILFAIIIVLLSLWFRKRNHKLFSDNGSFRINTKIKFISSLSVLVLVLMFTFVPIIAHHASEQDGANAVGNNTLSINASKAEFSYEIPQEEAFLYSFSKVTVEPGTSDGYTLLVYADQSDLLPSKSDNEMKISGLNTNNLHPVVLESYTWGLALEEPVDEHSENWYTMPTDINNAKVLKDVSSATSANDETTVFYGLKVDENIKADSYGNTLHYVAIAKVVPEPEPETYTIVYNANGGTGNMDSQSVVVGDSVTIKTNGFSYINHTFKNWNTQADGNGTSYNAGQVVTNGLTNTANSTITLYAQWDENKIYMQDMTDTMCQKNVGTNGNATNIGDNIVVYDKRSSNYASGDEGDYTVRWINGRCWMTQNLRIQGTISATYSNFTGADFNVSAYDLKDDGASGEECDNTNGVNNACSRTPDSADLTAIGNGVTVKSVGRWYNYYATSAGTISTDSNDTDVASDICPSGWHLPSGPANDPSSDYYVLFQSTVAQLSLNVNDYLLAFSASKGGAYNEGSLGSPTVGFYWTATSSETAARRYQLRYHYGDEQFSSSSTFRGQGNSVRCVKNEDETEEPSTDVAVTFSFDSGVGSVTVKEGDTEIGTTSVSGYAFNLEQGKTYTIIPSYRDGYVPFSITKTSGVGTLDGYNFTVADGPATINIVSRDYGYTIVYNDNGANSPTTMAVTHSLIHVGNNITLYASNYQRPGYGFAGWSFTQINPDADNATTIIKNTKIYGPNETITAPDRPTDSNTKTLYAVWIKSTGYIQNWSGCSSMDIGDVTARTDQRDNNTYAIAKLADGKCWMIENLRLDNTGTTGYNINDSSVTNESLSQGYGGVFHGLAESEDASAFNPTNPTSSGFVPQSNSLYGITGSGKPYIVDGGPYVPAESSFCDNPNNVDSDSCKAPLFRIPRYNNINTASTVESMANNYQNIYSYGNYYNWPAAIANTTQYFSSEQSEAANTSICPKGWELPTAGDVGKDFDTLADKLQSSYYFNYPNNFVFSGYPFIYHQYNNDIFMRGNYGLYWSQSSSRGYNVLYDWQNAHGLSLNKTKLSVDEWGKYEGASIRCLTDFTTHPITLTFDSGVGSVTVKEGDTEIGTTSVSGYAFNLEPGKTYTIVPSYRTGYLADAISLTDGSTGILDGYNFTVGDGTATINITSQPKIYMQDMTDAMCQKNVGINGNAENIGDNITVYDKRKNDGNNNYQADDEGDYTVRWINGQCWMTQNLRVQGTLSAEDSNFTGNNFNVSAYDFKTNGESGGECDITNGYNNACSSTPDSTDLATIGNGATTASVGRWYNYYAATAGTISGNDNITEAISDVCPSGWHLPTGPNTATGTDSNLLVGNTISDSQALTAGVTAFGVVASGCYANSSLNSTSYGSWWSATAPGSSTRYHLNYDSNELFSGDIRAGRYYGMSIRCVKNEDETEEPSAEVAITFTFDSGIEYVVIKEGDNEKGTISFSNHFINLEPDKTYTIVPKYRDNYIADTIAITSGPGTLNGYEFTVGSDSATISVTSQRKLYMQDLTDAMCQKNVNEDGIGENIVVFDKRSTNYQEGDEGDYTVRWINGQCWMTQNLRVQGTISAEYSNFTGDDFNVSAYDFKTNGENGGECDTTNGYNNACASAPDSANLATIGHGATLKTVGIWYSYYAITAGTISTDSNSTEATSDICPSGWHLPTGPSTTENTDFNILIGNTISGWQSPTAGLNAFGGEANGYYSGNTFRTEGGSGYWWSANATNNNSSRTSRHLLYYHSDDVEDYPGQFYGNGSIIRSNGMTARCVKDEDENSSTDVAITFSFDSGIEYVVIKEGDNEKGTISFSNHFINLEPDKTYTIVPKYRDNYIADTIAITSGPGTLNGYEFTVGSEPATISVTSQRKLYMQDMTDAQCQVNVGTNGNATGIGDEITVYDKRDEKNYTVKLINGQCWMTQNLRYLGDTGSAAGTMTIGNNNSNVANKSITLYSLDSSNAGSFNAYSSHCDSTNGYNYACVYDSGNTSTGVWYNYYAASAGTISTDSNSTAVTSDICPVGWHLPSGPNTTANTDFNKLVGNTTSGWQDPTAGLTAFSAVDGGMYYNGSLGITERGYWWSATANDTILRYNLSYDSSDGQFSGDYTGAYFGRFVRCVMKNYI